MGVRQRSSGLLLLKLILLQSPSSHRHGPFSFFLALNDRTISTNHEADRERERVRQEGSLLKRQNELEQEQATEGNRGTSINV